MHNGIVSTPLVSNIEVKTRNIAVKDEWKPDLTRIIAANNVQRLIPALSDTDVPKRYLIEFDYSFAVHHEGYLILECRTVTEFQVDLYTEIEGEEDFPLPDFECLAAEAAAHTRIFFLQMTIEKGLGGFLIGTRWDVFREPLMDMFHKFVQSNSRRH